MRRITARSVPALRRAACVLAGDCTDGPEDECTVCAPACGQTPDDPPLACTSEPETENT